MLGVFLLDMKTTSSTGGYRLSKKSTALQEMQAFLAVNFKVGTSREKYGTKNQYHIFVPVLGRANLDLRN